MKLALLLSALTLGAPCLASQTWAQATSTEQAAASLPAPRSPFAGLIAEYLRRDANGHSPTPDEISAMASLQPQPDAASIREAMPYLLKALENPDIPLHTFALTAIAGLQSPAPEAPTGSASDSSVRALPLYKGDVAKALAPFIPQLVVHLTTEESAENRLLVVALLGGFTPNPPATVYTPLLAYLKRDDAIGQVGLAVVADLFQVAPVTEDVATAITRYLRRSDQTSDSRANLADTIAVAPNQSQAVNKALLNYLDSDDNSLRARVILSLPQLDLAPDVFADTKARIDRMVSDPSENLQVVTAAKSIAPCWNAVKMAAGCPLY